MSIRGGLVRRPQQGARAAAMEFMQLHRDFLPGWEARTDAAGHPILLLDQDRALWDQLEIRRVAGARAGA